MPIPTQGQETPLPSSFQLALGAVLIVVLVGVAAYLAYHWQGRRRRPHRIFDVVERRSIARRPQCHRPA